MKALDLDSPNGHLLCTLAIFYTGLVLKVAFHEEFGKEVAAAALGSLWTLLQLRKTSATQTTLVASNSAATATTNSE